MHRLSAPFITVVSITGQCNLNCVYCYAHPLTGQHVPTSDVLRLVRELHDLGVFEIVLGGGEPFTHPEIFNILDGIFEFRERVSVLTNGTLLNEIACRRLAAYSSKRLHMRVQVSLDAIQGHINNAVRGCTDLTVNAIERLASTEVDLQIAAVVHKHNIAVAGQIIDEFYPRVKNFHFMNLMPSTKLRDNRRTADELCVDDIQLKNFFDALEEKVSGLPSDLHVSGCADYVREVDDVPRWSAPGCLAGITRCDIDADFNVLACSMAPEAILGNVRDRSFKSVWLSERARQLADMEAPLCSAAGRTAIAQCTDCHCSMNRGAR
ncbi:MAG: radical SAM protein [Phycisphaerales bacterium]|nr:radical SAM protein [Phycisphaerales bacterium]